MSYLAWIPRNRLHFTLKIKKSNSKRQKTAKSNLKTAKIKKFCTLSYAFQLYTFSFSLLLSNQPDVALYRKMGFLEEGRRIREIKIVDSKYVDEVSMCRFVDV
jgi:hypothetical protein